MQHLRQVGTVLAFDVVHGGDRFSERFHLAARASALIRPIGSTVYLMPPYLIDEVTATWLAAAVRDTLTDTLRPTADA